MIFFAYAAAFISAMTLASMPASADTITFPPELALTTYSYVETNPNSTAIVDETTGTLKAKAVSDGIVETNGSALWNWGYASSQLYVELANTGPTDVFFDVGAIRFDFDGDIAFNAVPGLDGLVADIAISASLLSGPIGGGFGGTGHGAHITRAPLELPGLLPTTNTHAGEGFSVTRADDTGYEGHYEHPALTIASGDQLWIEFQLELSAYAASESGALPSGAGTAVIIDALNTASLSLTLPGDVILNAPQGNIPAFVQYQGPAPAPVPLPAGFGLLLVALASIGALRIRWRQGHR